MLFSSTRSAYPHVSLLEAVEKGLAPDGGLYLPITQPDVDWETLPSNSFGACSDVFLTQWLGDALIPSQKKELVEEVVQDALNFEVPICFTPETRSYPGLHVLELFHGPTLSFKDFGARTLAKLLKARLAQSHQSNTILVATSGDTGSAVADGLSGIDGIRVILLYPDAGVSEVQEKQLITKRKGVLSLRVRGTFDDCQRLVKGAFGQDELAQLNLSTANSINMGRLIPQMLYYVWATRFLGSKQCQFVVPSGNLGNLTAGVLANLSGMPVTGFIAAHNQNDFFPRYKKSPDATFGTTVKTLSNAMDVGAPSNFERLQSLSAASDLMSRIEAISLTDEQTLFHMSQFHAETGYVADPHTAVGIGAAASLNAKAGPIVVLSTAHPAKFPDIVQQATSITPEVPAQLARLDHLPTRVVDFDPAQNKLADVLLAHKWD